MDNDKEVWEIDEEQVDEIEEKGTLLDLADRFGQLFENVLNLFEEESEEERINKLKE